MVKDDRGGIRPRLEMEQYAPCFTFYERAGKERLKVGLRTDNSPLIQVEQRDKGRSHGKHSQAGGVTAPVFRLLAGAG